MNKNSDNEWHWFKGGILVSLLSIFSYYIFQYLNYRKYPFGITGGFSAIAEKISFLFGDLSNTPYFQKIAENPSSIVELFLLIGLIIGGFVASKVNKTYKSEIIPDLWVKYQGNNIYKRFTFVVIGSILLGFGAVMASGCTTGNILQGWAHLSLGSIVAGICFFIGAIISAKLIFRKMEDNNVN